jgi:mxaJ protein
VEAVAQKDIDVAIVWGPLAGYFAGRQPVRLGVWPIGEDPGLGVPFAFNVSMGVQRGNHALKTRLDAIIQRRRGDIEKILDDYHIPRLPLVATTRSGMSKEKNESSSAGKPCDCD